MSAAARALALVLAVPAGAAQAELISTRESLDGRPAASAAAAQAQQDREHLRAVLRADGIEADQAAQRVQALTDAEVRRLASLIHLEPVGEGR